MPASHPAKSPMTEAEPMNEQELIHRAYGDTVETLYKVFFSEFTMAHGDEDSENPQRTLSQRHPPRPSCSRVSPRARPLSDKPGYRCGCNVIFACWQANPMATKDYSRATLPIACSAAQATVFTAEGSRRARCVNLNCGIRNNFNRHARRLRQIYLPVKGYFALSGEKKVSNSRLRKASSPPGSRSNFVV
jgi:hypothetical protein